MPLTREEKITLDYYEQNAKNWQRPTLTSDDSRQQIAYLLKHTKPCKILEIGCGPGRDAKELIASGFEYTGTDISKSFIKIAKNSNPEALFLPLSVYDLNFPKTSKFDSFWANGVLLHIPKNKIDQALTKIKQQLNPHAIGYLSLKLGEGEKLVDIEKSRITNKDKEFKRFFAFYSQDEIEQILTKNGFKILEVVIKSGPNNEWLWIIVQNV